VTFEPTFKNIIKTARFNRQR